MATKDTIRLLRECDAGIDMAIFAMDCTIRTVRSRSLRELLRVYRCHHEDLKCEIRKYLHRAYDDGRLMPVLLKGMAWVRIRYKLLRSPTDQTAARLISKGCSMGAETLSRYLDQYPAASLPSREITETLIRREVELEELLQRYV